ncbi:MAG: RsmF rRNA methyltransferase first C-terminal domain-containing protein [Bacteroidaceae bacterium]|nr:RsmF rRNA methyltransferase first C-terminal domain-containing protein [Bacteroidaceae bacterium]
MANDGEKTRLPMAFIDAMHQQMEKCEADGLIHAITDSESPVSIRINPMKWQRAMTDERVPWCETGFYLPKRPAFTFDPMFHAGCYYVQEASSMFLERILKQYVKEPSVVLDLCAAPGGKSTLALSCLPEGSLLVSNDPVRSRANILMENIIKWGYPNSVVTSNYAPDFQYLGELFDVVVADVPCSGEGMFRKDPTAIDEWSESNVSMCQKRQREIVGAIWSCLKPGGILVYSTCTYNIHEDEENLEWICGELGGRCLPVGTDETWGITGNLLSGTAMPCYHFFPHKAKGEGFFACVVMKDESTGNRPFSRTKKDKKKGKSSPKAGLDLTKFIKNADEYALLESDGVFSAFPKAYSLLLEHLQQGLHILHHGIELGEMKGKKICPSHSLAMSLLLHPDFCPSAELDHATSLAYLRREAIRLDASMAQGYVLITHQGIPLGFVNNLGNRSNNLYPEYWKIRQRE